MVVSRVRLALQDLFLAAFQAILHPAINFVAMLELLLSSTRTQTETLNHLSPGLMYLPILAELAIDPPQEDHAEDETPIQNPGRLLQNGEGRLCEHSN